MRKKRPIIATLEQVSISREGETAIIAYKNSSISTVHLQIGSGISEMSDEEILELHNATLRAQEEFRKSNKWMPKEVKPGQPQLKFDEYGRLSMQGDVLRCEVSDGGTNCETTIIIDEREFSMEEFGKIIKPYAGWGMRMVFVDADDTESRPLIEIYDPND